MKPVYNGLEEGGRRMMMMIDREADGSEFIHFSSFMTPFSPAPIAALKIYFVGTWRACDVVEQ